MQAQYLLNYFTKMRNKGFFWFLTILLTAICIYQLSFTWVSTDVERKAEKEAEQKVAELKEKAAKHGNKAYLPNSQEVDFSNPEAEELAKAAYINQILKDKAETPVYPLFGTAFKDVKQRSLAFGLDLVGGMSVTLEVSIPELVKSYALDTNSLTFRKPFDAALDVYRKEGGDFVDIFVKKHNELNKKTDHLVDLFAHAYIDELGRKSTDDDVIAFLTEKESKAMVGVEEIMNRRINQFGVAQPNIQKDPANNRLYIELPGVQDEATVEKKLVATANLKFYETYSINDIALQWQDAINMSRTEETDEDDEEVEEEPDTTADNSVEVIDTAADIIDTTATPITESLSLDAELGGESGQKDLSTLVQGVGNFGGAIGYCTSADRPDVDRILNRKDIKKRFSEDNIIFMWSADLEIINPETKELGYYLYAITVPASGRPRVGGEDISSASRDYNQQEGKVVVSLTMTQEGQDKWGQMTQDNVDDFVAITMDNVVYSAPRVNDPILNGRTEISGGFSIQEAEDLAGLLNGGALPAPCLIKEQTKVGPTIGKENARAGLISFAAALLLVFIYMIFYYGKAGVIADIALFANILFIFGSLSSFGAVLTLAGIAGIVLTIGMAVDANVLIFERVREEQAAGKDVKSAIDTGFKKALSSIIDANVTTMLTAIVLKVFGSGPIESFATTLIIGIFTSVFAALVITRLCMNWWMNKGKGINFESKITKGAFKNLNFNFVGKRKIYYAVSGVLVALSIGALVTKQLNPSVEFSGGRTYTVKFDKAVSNQIEYMRNELQNVFVEDGKKASVEIKTKGSSYTVEIMTNYMLGDETAGPKVKTALTNVFKENNDKFGSYLIPESRTVSPTVSKELVTSSMIAIVLSLLIIFTYILMRFGRWQYSTGAIIAMTHDVIIVLGIFAGLHGILPFNMDVDQAFVAAILTVIGYSINDTVIVFDRIRENLGLHKSTDENENINNSLNSTLSRTINTSMTTFIVLLIIFIFGGAAIKGFIFALMVGVLVGTYSSVCIATPVLIDFSKKVRTKSQG